MTRYLIAGAAVFVVITGLIVALLAMRDQRDVARGRANTLAEQVAARDAALAQEKAATAEALGDMHACNVEQAEQRERRDRAEAQLFDQLARYRAMLGKCQSPDALIERGGRLFPAPVSP